MPEDEQRLSASPFEEYFWRDTKGMCSPEQAQYIGGTELGSIYGILELNLAVQ